jgi:branched-chain amino acid transport system substrate-binding protein
VWIHRSFAVNVRSPAALIAVVALVNWAGVATAADPLEIPAILPVTGPAAFLGKEFGETLKLIEDRTNKAGGISGRPIHFAIQDDQSSPQVAVQLSTGALTKNPPLVVNGGPLALCAAAAPLMKNGPVLWCLSPSLRVEAGSYAYGVMASSRDCLIAGLNYYKSRGLKRIGVLNGTDATGADADEILGDAIKLPEYAGMSFVDYEHYNLADLSVSAQVSRIKAAGAQAMIAYTTGAPIATVLHGVADAGLDIPVFSSNGNMSIAQLDGYKSFAPKEFLFAGYAAFDADPVGDGGVKQKITEFKSDMKTAGLSPDLLHAIPWDPALLIVETFRRIGPNATPAQLRDSFASVANWAGMLGRYDFHAIPNRGLGLKALTVLKWDPIHSAFVSAGKNSG